MTATIPRYLPLVCEDCGAPWNIREDLHDPTKPVRCIHCEDPETMTIGSLFSGIGGLELGLEWAGLGPVLWQCEVDPFCRQVLAKHWPNATRYEDVRAVDASVPRVDVLCGGFPCQDISNAGKRAGIRGERSGLWSEFARVIGLLRPSFVVVENVSALLGRGMDRVCGDLAALGYDAQWSALRASDVGAPHRRERIFIVAHARCERGERRGELGESGGEAPARSGEGLQRQRDRYAAVDCGTALAHEPDAFGRGEGLADPASQGREGPDGSGEPSGERRTALELERQGDAWREGRSTQPGLGRAAHGLPARVDRWPAGPAEEQHPWEAPRVVTGRTVNRPARLRALGNAVVPQCAQVVGEVILEMEKMR